MNKKLKQLSRDINAFEKDHLVAFQTSSVSWNEFQSKVNVWSKVCSGSSEKLVAVYHHDAVEFAAILFACWRAEKVPVIPANTLLPTCEKLAKITSSFVGDFAVNVNELLVVKENSSYQLEENTALIVFTSGSQGDPEPIKKSFSQLDSELSTLEQCWGDKLASSVIVGMVSHHHIYGLLFRLLWPLATGRVFVGRERQYWEEIIEDGLAYSHICLIASPAHYSRMPPLDWKCLNEMVAVAFSSGAPLKSDDASVAGSYLSCSVIEVYGSSETGGVAWREQTQDIFWQPFDGIAVSISGDEQLVINSPHLADESAYCSSDIACINDDGKFELRGRADRIVKLSGKRISLSAVEKTLLENEFIADVRVLHLTDKQDRLGAVLVLNSDGNDILIDKGKLWFSQYLRKYLQCDLESVAVPRYWRFLSRLPENSEGKITLSDLLSLFDSSQQSKSPELISSVIDGNKCELNLFVPASLYYFNGHFPGRPILPGVVQIHWAVAYAKQLLDVDLTADLKFLCLEVIKFQQVVNANDHLILSLIFSDDNKLIFSYEREGRKVSSGRVVFSSTGDE